MFRDKLTIILTVKGRSEYTFRWLEYAKLKKFPFSILIADGSSDFSVKEYIDKSNLEELNIKYVKFEEDKNFEIFYSKVKKSFELIETEYCIMADNDDFYSLNGLMEAVRFLDENKDYVACGGRLATFKIENGQVYGNLVDFYSSNYSYYSEPKPKDRIIKYLSGAPGPYYSVIKTALLRNVWKDICRQNFKDIRITELLIEIYILTSGKVYNLERQFYFRQVGINIGNTAKLSHDFFDEIFSPTWSVEINYIADVVVERCGNTNFSHQEFWFYLKQFLLPRVLNGIALDSYDNSTKIGRIMLGKSLRSVGFFSLLKELLFWKIRKNFAENDEDVKFIRGFLTKTLK